MFKFDVEENDCDLLCQNIRNTILYYQALCIKGHNTIRLEKFYDLGRKLCKQYYEQVDVKLADITVASTVNDLRDTCREIKTKFFTEDAS